jgi:hypothetical protein
MTYWRAEWTTADNFTNSVIVDISTLAPAPTVVKVLAIKATLNGDIEAKVEFDATTHVLIYTFEGQSDSSMVDVADFTLGASEGRTISSAAVGFVGDIILTTANVASGDELTLLIFYQGK